MRRRMPGGVSAAHAAVRKTVILYRTPLKTHPKTAIIEKIKFERGITDEKTTCRLGGKTGEHCRAAAWEEILLIARTDALKICPDLIRILSKTIGLGIIVTCGTNGKTTTNNLLDTALQKCGYRTVCNSLGANMLGGIATAFAQACDWRGRCAADYGVFEVDEAFARRVLTI